MAAVSANADAEEATATALARLPTPWAVVRDPVWPEDAHPNVDHIVVGPPGVFVIDTRSWSGRVALEHGRLWQNGQDRSDALASVAEAAVSVSGFVSSVRFDHVHPVVCCAGREISAGWVDGVLVCSSDKLVEELTSYVDVLPGGVSKVVAVDIERRLLAGTRPRPKRQRTKKSRPGRVAQASGVRRRRPFKGLVLATLAGAVGVLLVAQPSLITRVPDRFAELVDFVQPDEKVPYEGNPPKPEREKKRHNQKQAPPPR